MTSIQPFRNPTIEPLESRIAPALLVNGANLLGVDSPSTGETSVGDHSLTLVKVSAGRVMVWFDGADITGISVGPGAKFEVFGDVEGDIVANLTADGHLSDSDGNPANGEDGGVLLPNDISGFKTHPLSSEKGSVNNIITGGGVSNVEIAGTLGGLYAGDGAFRLESSIVTAGVVTSSVDIDINPIVPGLQSSFSFAKANAHFKAGASINGISIERADNLQVFAGNGSPDGSAATGTAVAGGSISNLKIELATVLGGSAVNTPSYHLLAGDGGDGKVGGAGGSITSIIEAKSSGPVLIHAGRGGAGNGGAGGAGGNVLSLDLQSASSQYDVSSGDGGPGTPGGAGGRVSNSNFSNRTPIAGVLVSADFTGDGLDDVLVGDSGTGLLVVNKNLGAAGFIPIVQDGTNITITSLGVSPIDALASDVNGDGMLDAVVLYRDGTMSAFLNQGGGVFYDVGNSAFAVESANVGFIPYKFSEMSPGSGVFTIAENTGGEGILHGLLFTVSPTGLTTEAFPGKLKYSRPIADLAGDFVGLNDGNIEEVTVAFGRAGKSLAVIQKIKPAANGGLDDLDVDAGHTKLLALSGAGKALTIYDLTTPAATALPIVSLNTIPGQALLAKFIDDQNPLVDDDIVVLSNALDNAQFTQFTAPAPSTPPGAYTASGDFESDTLLKNFAPVYAQNSTQLNLAAVAGPLNAFTEVTSLVSEQEFSLPFASKQVNVATGHGGTGLDVGTKLGKGGAGGSIININIDAQKITLSTGLGGNSNNGPAGAGGSISNSIPSTVTKDATGATTTLPGSFRTAGGALVAPKLVAEAGIQIALGDGGAPLGAGGKTASGGAGGGLVALDITLTDGEVELATGTGGNGKGAAGGAGGDLAKVFVHASHGGLLLSTGNGGNALGAAGNGGAGGTINSLRYTLTLDQNAEKDESPYEVTIVAGIGGESAAGVGGAGGEVAGVALKLDGADRSFDNSLINPPTVDTHRDSTISVSVVAGNAGNGAKGGGAGGNLRNFVTDSVYDQISDLGVTTTYVTLALVAGRGGNASAGNGGLGGSVILTSPISGITSADPDQPGFNINSPALLALGGPGGNGSLAGGAGGSVSGLTAQNSGTPDGAVIKNTHLFSAVLAGGVGGNGGTGNGGVGGAVSNALVGVNGGFLGAFAGPGGGSTNAKGGAGGAVSGSEFGLVSSFFDLGMDIEGGDGGAGKTGGGIGGALTGLRINTPQSTTDRSAVLLSGDGGAASSASAVGGKGGDISGITQAKDYNSSINLIQAGNGGANLVGKGGAGGNILNIRTVGFIGRPSDGINQLGVFDGSEPQGLFSGRGGDGTIDGVNGSISKVVARQIAAMAAAVDNNGLFAAASKISNVTAALIGFDANGDGIFNTTGANGTSPATVKPVDGFILATALSQVVVTRPAFTFTA